MYSEKIAENFSFPTHNGIIDPCDLTLENKDPVCGDQVNITADIKDGSIVRARFKAWGCAASIASANIFCSWMEGKTVEEIIAADRETLAGILGELRPEQRHCIDILHHLASAVKQQVETVS